MVYLDNSATTKPCQAAIDAVRRTLEDDYFNPSAVYAPAVQVFTALRTMRDDLLNSVQARNCLVTFTSGGTEANNLAILGAVRHMHGSQRLAVSAVEHPSVRACFDRLAREGHDVRILPVDDRGTLRWEAVERAVREGVSLISCMQVNNETGAVLDAKRLKQIVGTRAVIHVDGVQGYLRVPFDMACADLYTISSHKIHGPKGVGALIRKKNLMLEPVLYGGGQELGLRSGTENVPGIAGFCAAAKALSESGAPMRQELMEHKRYFAARVLELLPDTIINGPEPELGAPHILNLSFPGVRGEVLLHALEERGIYASTGSACSSKKRKSSAVLTAMGMDYERAESAMRFSLSPMTTKRDLDEAAEALGSIVPFLKQFKRKG